MSSLGGVAKSSRHKWSRSIQGLIQYLGVILLVQKFPLFRSGGKTYFRSVNKAPGIGWWCYNKFNTPVSQMTSYSVWCSLWLNILRPRQNGRHFADDIFKSIFLNENAWITLKISLKFVSKVRINNIPALVQTLAWRGQGDKTLAELMMASLLTHICVTWPQWVDACLAPGTIC